MAVHDLDMTRFLAGEDPIEILAVGSCHIDKSIEDLPGSEAFDTATCIVRYPNGVNAMVDVCRQSGYGYDQRAEVLGTGGMIATDNVYPNTAKIYKNGACRGGAPPPGATTAVFVGRRVVASSLRSRQRPRPPPFPCHQTSPATPTCPSTSSSRGTSRPT